MANDEIKDPADALGQRRRPPPPIIDLTAQQSDRQSLFSSHWEIAAGLLAVSLIVLLIAGAVWLTPPSRNDAMAPLLQKIAALESQLRDLGARLANAADRKTSEDNGTRLAGLEAKLKAVQSDNATGAAKLATDLDRGLAELNDRVARLQDQTQSQAQTQITDSDAKELRGRMTLTEAGVQSAIDKTNELSQRVGLIAGLVQDAKTRAESALAATELTTQSATARASNEIDRREIETLTARLQKFEQALTQIGRSDSVQNDADRGLRLAFVAAALRQSFDRGDPYHRELQVLNTLIQDKAALEPIARFATSGAPTLRTLARELSALSPAMQRASASGESGLFDRLQANAEKLVRVRPIGDSTGTEPVAIMSRAEQKLERGDVTGALSDLASLPAPIRALAAPWIEQAKARQAASEAVSRLTNDAFLTLSKSER